MKTEFGDVRTLVENTIIQVNEMNVFAKEAAEKHKNSFTLKKYYIFFFHNIRQGSSVIQNLNSIQYINNSETAMCRNSLIPGIVKICTHPNKERDYEREEKYSFLRQIQKTLQHVSSTTAIQTIILKNHHLPSYNLSIHTAIMQPLVPHFTCQYHKLLKVVAAQNTGTIYITVQYSI